MGNKTEIKIELPEAVNKVLDKPATTLGEKISDLLEIIFGGITYSKEKLEYKDIVILNTEEVKEKCLDEFLQLGKGLYFGKKSNGDTEVFRDLFTSVENVGLYYKNNEVNNYIYEKIEKIIKKINLGELVNYYTKYIK